MSIGSGARTIRAGLFHSSFHVIALNRLSRLHSVRGFEPKHNLFRVIGVAVYLFGFDPGFVPYRFVLIEYWSPLLVVASMRARSAGRRT